MKFKKFLKEWLEALESGEYTHTKSRLTRRELGKECFCAQGVYLKHKGYHTEYFLDGEGFFVTEKGEIHATILENIHKLPSDAYRILRTTAQYNDESSNYDKVIQYLKDILAKDIGLDDEITFYV